MNITGEDIRKNMNRPVAHFKWSNDYVTVYADRGYWDVVGAIDGIVGLNWQTTYGGTSCKYTLEIDPRFTKKEIEDSIIEAILSNEPVIEEEK